MNPLEIAKVSLRYEWQTVFVMHVFTHQDYDDWTCCWIGPIAGGQAAVRGGSRATRLGTGRCTAAGHDMGRSPRAHGWNATFTGTAELVAVPSPNWPYSLSPQHQATPVPVTPQVDSSPALM